jgi:phage N-6-adenine-methyltransferase
MNPVHYRSKTDDWSTPAWFYDQIHSECSPTLDVCAVASNAKCERYFSPEVDGLKQEWPAGEVCWMNPPYGREIGRWVEKAYRSSLLGVTVVSLLPARTDTVWWHRFVTKAFEIRFLRGRLKFGKAKHSAPFPSAVVIFKPGKHDKPLVRFVDLADLDRSLFGNPN